MRIADKYNLISLANAIYDTGANLAERRIDWLALMFSMAGGGEPLRASFHKLASQGSTYRFKENDREFSKAIKKTSDENLAWLLKKAKELGINLDDHLSLEGRRAREDRIYTRKSVTRSLLPSIRTQRNMNYIPNEYLAKCRSNNSTFVKSLVSSGILTQEQATAAADLYRLGAMRDGSVIFWQIDTDGCIRDGKVMQYDTNCHRLKEQGAQWMGWLMRYKLKGTDGKFLLQQDWHATQCLFGQHLLADNSSLLTPNSSLICIVEAEKTAVILSQLMPDKLWLAAGGEQQLSVYKLDALRGHKVILYPDTDPDGATFAHWQQIANESRLQLGLNISVSNLLETHASADQKERKIDLVDFLIETRGPSPDPSTREGSSHNGNPVSPEVTSMIEDNPAMQDLIEAFDLVEVNF